MNLKRLVELVDLALSSPSPEIVKNSEPYYSPYYQLMYLVAKDFMGDSYDGASAALPICVELGVEGGRGSFALLQSGALVIGVDNNPDRKFVHADNKNFKMIIGSSLPPPKYVTDCGLGSISLLHVDTEHSFAQAREEFNAYKPYLRDGAVVLFDDTNACEGEVKNYVESLPYDKFLDDRLHPSCGYMGMVYRVGG